jgi:predicted ATPase
MERISIKGFKGIKDKTEIALKNLTIFFGYNNCGKSTVLRTIPIISDSFKNHAERNFISSYINYESEPLRGAIHSDIINTQCRDIEFGIHWETEGIEVAIRQDAMEPEFVNKLSIFKDGDKQEFRPSIDDPFIFESTDGVTLPFNSFHSFEYNNLSNLIKVASSSIHWVSSMRSPPPRDFQIGLGIPVGINYKGEGLGETLWHIFEHNRDAYNDVNNWLRDTTNRQLIMNSSQMHSIKAGRANVKLQTVSAQHDSSQVDIIDSGEGIAQALPVVTLCAMASNGMLGQSPIIAIEQPELHLHPKAIIILANFLVNIIKNNKNIKLVIETHSESFLLAIQTAIVKDELNSNELSCYWVDKVENETNISSITFDSQGFIEGSWPQSVFREIIAQSKELLNARDDSA